MAYDVNELKVVQVTSVGGEGRIRVIGQSINTGASDTSFVISPGNNSVNITDPVTSVGMRHIDTWELSNATAEKAPQVVKTYDSTNDTEILTITCAADDDYNWWVEGPTVGA